MNKKMSTPPRILSNKYLYRIVCAIICAIFAFMLVGCGDSDYKNFIQNQKRYEAEKELVDLLRDYDTAYTSYKGGANDGINIVFSICGVTVLTDAYVTAAMVAYTDSSYCTIIEFNNSGADILMKSTANNIGEQLEVIAIKGDSRSVLLSAYISAPMYKNTMLLEQATEEAANNLCNQFRMIAVKNAAAAYNAKRIALSDQTVSVDYLPLKLPETPEFSDVSSYLQKADKLGF